MKSSLCVVTVWKLRKFRGSNVCCIYKELISRIFFLWEWFSRFSTLYNTVMLCTWKIFCQTNFKKQSFVAKIDFTEILLQNRDNNSNLCISNCRKMKNLLSSIFFRQIKSVVMYLFSESKFAHCTVYYYTYTLCIILIIFNFLSLKTKVSQRGCRGCGGRQNRWRRETKARRAKTSNSRCSQSPIVPGIQSLRWTTISK